MWLNRRKSVQYFLLESAEICLLTVMPHREDFQRSLIDTCNSSWSVSSNLPIASQLINSHDVANSVRGLVFLNFTKRTKQTAEKSLLRHPRNILLWAGQFSRSKFRFSPLWDSLLFSLCNLKANLVLWFREKKKVLFQLGCSPVITKTWLKPSWSLCCKSKPSGLSHSAGLNSPRNCSGGLEDSAPIPVHQGDLPLPYEECIMLRERIPSAWTPIAQNWARPETWNCMLVLPSHSKNQTVGGITLDVHFYFYFFLVPLDKPSAGSIQPPRASLPPA